MAPYLSKQAANLITKAAPFAAAIAACAGLLWIVGVLLLTRQTCLLLILMSGVGIGFGGMAFLARKRGRRVLFALAMAGLALAVGLGLMALADMLEPEPSPNHTGILVKESFINRV